MEQKPLLSVIVPVHNVERYLDQCVRSILAQTYERLELLLIDDGSPDRSGAICDAWAARDRRVRVFHQENGGAGRARNLGLDRAQGALIGFVDSDDYIAPWMYERLYDLLGDRDIAECGYVETADDHAVFDRDCPAPEHFAPQKAMEAHLRDTAFRQLIWNKLYRREVLADVRFPEGTRIDDEFFTYRALGNARALVRCPHALYAYRQHGGSVMHGLSSRRRLEGLEAKRARLNYIREKMPALAPLARWSLLESCMYVAQDFLKTGADRREVLRYAKPLLPMAPCRALGLKANVWIAGANVSFEGTCRLRNFLFERT